MSREVNAGEAVEAGGVEVVPATVERSPNVVTILGANGDRGCWFQAPRGRAVGYGKAVPGARPATLRAQIEDDDPPPGMLADVDGTVAGWCRPRILMRLDFATELGAGPR